MSDTESTPLADQNATLLLEASNEALRAFKALSETSTSTPDDYFAKVNNLANLAATAVNLRDAYERAREGGRL